MKKGILFTLAILMPLTAMATPKVALTSFEPSDNSIPAKFRTSGETKSMEWACPIDNEEFSESEIQKAVVNRLVSECIEQVSRAAEQKPEVAAVIQASLIAPNITFNRQANGSLRVNGTIFLKTDVTLVQ